MTSPLQRTGQFAGVLTNAGVDPHFDRVGGWAGAPAPVTFTFMLVDGKTGLFIRTLSPVVDSVPQLTHDTSRVIVRQLTGLLLNPADAAAVDTIAHRVRVALVTADGTSYPLGRYMFSSNSTVEYAGQDRSALTLLDESFVLDQALASAFPNSGLPGDSVNCGALASRLVGLYPTVDLVVEGTPYGTTNSWAFGAAGMQVLQDLAKLGDYFPAWMGHDAALHMVRSFDPAQVLPDLDWDRYPHVVADTVTRTDNLLTAPNRFVVVGNGTSAAGAAAVVGTYDVPASAPHSIQNRGFVIPYVQQLQVDSSAQARAVATAYGIRNTLYQTTTATTFPDPRHDSYDVIRWRGANWLELSWSMPLVAGGAMTHTMRKTYP